MDESVLKPNIPPSQINSNSQLTTLNKYCTKCNKTFSTTSNLRNHIMTVHEKHFPFKCPYSNCTKAYSIETRLKVHLKTHIGQKPFVCGVCGKGFVEKGNLKTHIRFHSTLRPYKCSLCNKSYKTNGHLKDHIDIQHYYIKKYHCDICGNDFGRSSTLKAHIRTHMGVKNIKCLIEGCEKYFSEKGNMIIHYKRHLMKVQSKKEGKHLLNENDAVLTRPESNVTLVNKEESRMEMDSKLNLYDEDVVGNEEVMESNVNDIDDHMILNNKCNSNMNNKFNGYDIQIDEKDFQLSELEKIYEFPNL